MVGNDMCGINEGRKEGSFKSARHRRYILHFPYQGFDMAVSFGNLPHRESFPQIQSQLRPCFSIIFRMDLWDFFYTQKTWDP